MILAFRLLYVKDFSTLVLIIIGNLIGRNIAVKTKRLNEKLDAKGELAKRINFIKIEDELNAAITKDFNLFIKDTKENTKLIIIDNFLNNLPAITMNDISEISLSDLRKMISNIPSNDQKDNITNFASDLSKTKDRNISLTSKKSNHNNYNYNHNSNNNNKNTYDENLSKNKEKIKTKKKNHK